MSHSTALRTNARARILAALAASVLLVACGSDQVAGIQGSGAPVAAGVTSVGTVTGFGSVFVDGIEYGTSSAQIRLDDQAGTESQLRVGQIVTVRGTLDASGNAGTASEITFVSDVKGPIGQVDLASSTFTVLGQTVRVTDATLFDESIRPAELATVNAGAAVQVSGFMNAAGEIVASRIDATSSTELQLKGTAQSLDTTARTFRINTLAVDYSAASVSGTLANGSPVIVRGNSVNPSGVLVATRVQVVGGTGAANDNGRVEGLITSFTSNADFSVNGLRVVTDSSTQFVLQGLTLGVDLPVKVRGTFNANGALLASRVEAKQNSSGIVRGPVDAVSAANNTLTVLGVAITTTSTTSLEDRSSQHIRQFRLSDVRVGDLVEVRGTAGASGSGLTAALLVRHDPASDDDDDDDDDDGNGNGNRGDVQVQGAARNVADPNFTVLGVQVLTNAQTRFIGTGGQAAAREIFFSQPAHDLVTVQGTVTGGILVADRVQVRD